MCWTKEADIEDEEKKKKKIADTIELKLVVENERPDDERKMRRMVIICDFAKPTKPELKAFAEIRIRKEATWTKEQPEVTKRGSQNRHLMTPKTC